MYCKWFDFRTKMCKPYHTANIWNCAERADGNPTLRLVKCTKYYKMLLPV